eukprot:gene12807-14745_t
MTAGSSIELNVSTSQKCIRRALGHDIDFGPSIANTTLAVVRMHMYFQDILLPNLQTEAVVVVEADRSIFILLHLHALADVDIGSSHSLTLWHSSRHCLHFGYSWI